jgi:hypothetical protein
MKVEALTRQLEEEMERREEEEYFGECCTCQQKVTGAGQACQVHTHPGLWVGFFSVKTYLWTLMFIELAFLPEMEVTEVILVKICSPLQNKT